MPPTLQQVRLAEELAKPDVTMKQAFLSAGYSENVAKMGRASIPKAVVKLMKAKGYRQYLELGRELSLSLEDQKNLIVGRLAANLIEGTDKGAQSAKILGSQKDLNMFQADSVSGVIVLNMPITQSKDELLKPSEPQE